MTTTLTLAILMSMVDELPPTPRIIVGMPFVDSNGVVELTSVPRIFFIGKEAYAKLLSLAQPHDPDTDPFGLLMGIPIEPFGSRHDHGDLLALYLGLPDVNAPALRYV